jgi:hypothetical protein
LLIGVDAVAVVKSVAVVGSFYEELERTFHLLRKLDFIAKYF